MAEEERPQGGFVYQRYSGPTVHPVENFWAVTKYDSFPEDLIVDGGDQNLFLRSFVADPITGECLPMYELSPEHSLAL